MFSNSASPTKNMSPADQRALLTQLLQTHQQPKTAPLSFGQERLWFLNQLDPNSSAYNLRTAVRLTGQLDHAAMTRSLNEIVRRHEALRTTFQDGDGDAQQVIAQKLIVDLPLHDLSSAAADIRQQRVAEAADAEAQRPFDLQQGPLFRACLLKVDSAEFVLLITMHHSVSDGWSIGLMLHELSVCYEAFIANTTPQLPKLKVQYPDFTRWQRDWLRGERLQKQLDYWTEQLAKPLPTLALPTDRPRPQIQSFRGARHYFAFEKAVSAELHALTQRHSATIFMTLLAAYKTLLMRLTQQRDLLVGTPVAGRNREDLHGLIGLFINTIVIRSQPQPEQSFSSYLEQVREQSMGAFSHQDLPFEKIVEAIQPQRDASRSPIFQTLFILQNVPMEAVELSNLKMTTLRPNKASSQVDLGVTMWDGADGLTGFFEYNTDLLDATTVARWSSHFEHLLQSIASNPKERLDKLPLLPAHDATALLTQFNDTATDHAPSTLLDHFAAQVAHAPSKIALVFADQALTYGDLNARANQLANYLAQFNLSAGELVGICIDRSLEMVVALLAVLKAGAAYVPLDPSYPTERLSYMLDHAEVSVLLAQPEALALCPAAIAQWQASDRATTLIDVVSDWNEIAQQPDSAPQITIEPLQRAYVIYTSGSTGKPKGVQIGHQALVNFLLSMKRKPGLSAEDTLLAVTTLSFDIAGLELYLPLISGAKLLIASRELAADGHALAATLNDIDVTVMQATPVTWRLLLAAGWQGSPQLKALCGGEALLHSLAQELVPRCQSLWNLYGPTETTVWSSVHQVQAAEPLLPSGTITIGQPIDNTQLHILDSAMQPVPLGVAGDLYIGGSGLADGYLNRSKLTEARFLPSPHYALTDAPTLYQTGDVARYLPNGDVEFLGRKDQQVKVRGFRIELGEIETTLARHVAVREAVAAVYAGASDKQLVAYVVLDEGGEEFSAETLSNYLAEQLPAYMVPTIIMPLGALPQTLNGKIDRRALPKPQADHSASRYVAPSSDLEQTLVTIWQELLNIEHIGVRDSFFNLGGHSLIATRLVTRVRHTFGVAVSLRDLFIQPTIAALAAQIETAQGGNSELAQLEALLADLE